MRPIKEGNCKLFQFILLPVFIGLIFSFIVLNGCDPKTTNTTYKGSVQGWIYDAINRAPLSGVKMFSPEKNKILYTDGSGKFVWVDIDLPSSDYGCEFIRTKAGYMEDTIQLLVKSDVMTTYDSLFMERDTVRVQSEEFRVKSSE